MPATQARGRTGEGFIEYRNVLGDTLAIKFIAKRTTMSAPEVQVSAGTGQTVLELTALVENVGTASASYPVGTLVGVRSATDCLEPDDSRASPVKGLPAAFCVAETEPMWSSVEKTDGSAFPELGKFEAGTQVRVTFRGLLEEHCCDGTVYPVVQQARISGNDVVVEKSWTVEVA